jgi:hypothetical protein
MTTRTLQRLADPADHVLLAGTLTLTGILLSVTRHASSAALVRFIPGARTNWHSRVVGSMLHASPKALGLCSS